MTEELSFGQWVKRRRRGLGLTQRQLAERIRYAVDTIRNVESDELRPSVALAARLAEGLALPPDQRADFVRFARDEADDAPTVPTPEPPPSPGARPLPAPLTSFIGREAEVAALVATLRQPDIRLVTLVGAGGVGKTRTALQVAEALRGDFEGGIAFVPLAAISEPELVLPTVAEGLGVKEGRGRPLAESLKQALAQGQWFLVLDNFEQVPDAAPHVAALLQACPRLTVLVTSRAALRVQGEHEYALRPLATPPTPADLNLPALEQSPAVRLFIQRAQAVRRDFRLTAANAEAVAQICQRLDGLPLALELAAARLRSLAPAELLARLDHRFELLRQGPRDMPARHQALQAALDWSYQLLPPQEQLLLARLAVCVGGWTLEAAEAVGAGKDAEAVLDGLDGLISQSLVEQSEGVDGSRYSMLETIREYGLERLAEWGESEAARQRHLDYYLGLVEAVAPGLRGADQRLWLNRLEAEHDNARAALRWALDRGQAEHALRLGRAMGPLWAAHAHWREGRRWLHEALASSPEAPASLRAPALHQAGVLARRQGDFEAARVLFTESLDLHRALGNHHGVASALNNLGTVDYSRGQYSSARARYTESLELYAGLGDERGVAACLDHLGTVAWAQGDYPSATDFYQRSLALWRRLVGEEHISIAQALNNLGNVAWGQQDYAVAAAYYQQSLDLYERLGDTSGVAWALNNLGNVAWAQGRLAEARERLTHSLSLFRALGDLPALAICLTGLAYLAHSLGEDEGAARLVSAAEALFASTGSGLAEVDRPAHQRIIAEIRAALGDEQYAGLVAEGRSLTVDAACASAHAVGQQPEAEGGVPPTGGGA